MNFQGIFLFKKKLYSCFIFYVIDHVYFFDYIFFCEFNLRRKKEVEKWFWKSRCVLYDQRKVVFKKRNPKDFGFVCSIFLFFLIPIKSDFLFDNWFQVNNIFPLQFERWRLSFYLKIKLFSEKLIPIIEKINLIF